MYIIIRSISYDANRTAANRAGLVGA
jgi:hypothetical protein